MDKFYKKILLFIFSFYSFAPLFAADTGKGKERDLEGTRVAEIKDRLEAHLHIIEKASNKDEIETVFIKFQDTMNDMRSEKITAASIRQHSSFFPLHILAKAASHKSGYELTTNTFEKITDALISCGFTRTEVNEEGKTPGDIFDAERKEYEKNQPFVSMGSNTKRQESPYRRILHPNPPSPHRNRNKPPQQQEPPIPSQKLPLFKLAMGIASTALIAIGATLWYYSSDEENEEENDEREEVL